MCFLEGLPAVKWFSATDDTATYPTPIKCVKVDQAVAGVDFKTWAGWFKLVKFISRFPPL